MVHDHDLPLTIARIQFAFTVGVHIIFPAFSIGLSVFLTFLEGMWLKTNDDRYLNLFKYWLKVFSIVFGMGVVSGIVMAYEFGTNWAGFSAKAGPITGVLLSYEVMTAFFMEAGFLGVMLFGLNRVGRRMHYFATCAVTTGTLISMTWILASNSWMQTPQGYVIDPKTGHFLPHDWLAIIFNPSFPYRITHMGLAAMLSVAFTVAAAGAWHLLKAKKNGTQADSTIRLMFSLSLWMIVVTAPLQIIAGDMHGLNTLKYQPAKIAAMEGDWTSETRAPELLFGIPNMKTEHTDYAIGIPLLGSFILTHDINGKVPGLKDYPADQRAPAPIVFFSFRIMIALGGLMLLCGLWSLWLRRRQRLFDHPLFLRVILAMAPAGFLALLCGWVTTEVGRQPWTVYGLLRTKDSASPLALSSLSFSMLFFVAVYLFVFGSGLLMLIRLLRAAPAAADNTNDDIMILGSHHHTVSQNKDAS